ncbi:hypothetical protein GQ44DRAFT_422919 [Phaeosphaeriaceae sp. PMI808]|nr:hypothetical protein GQ44DRAFT_422919 [Phaeosphaeriaceae sp. PMI808]
MLQRIVLRSTIASRAWIYAHLAWAFTNRGGASKGSERREFNQCGRTKSDSTATSSYSTSTISSPNSGRTSRGRWNDEGRCMRHCEFVVRALISGFSVTSFVL